jgi:hypothetical protein
MAHCAFFCSSSTHSNTSSPSVAIQKKFLSLTASYRILPHPTASYRILPIRRPFAALRAANERQTSGKAAENETSQAKLEGEKFNGDIINNAVLRYFKQKKCAINSFII